VSNAFVFTSVTMFLQILFFPSVNVNVL
jgi:hypothetical protein